MAKIRNYVTDNNITDQDIVVGSDGDNSGVTKNFNVAALKTYVSNGLVEEAPIDGVVYSRKDGHWIASSLPADEVIEVDTYANLPSPGAINILYLTLDTGQLWTWDGSYSEVSQENISPLSTITEGGSVGIARTGRNPLYYGNIGANAVDLSLSTIPSSAYGATGVNSFATGKMNEASGPYSSSEGFVNKSTGLFSSTSGLANTASGYAEMAIGFYGTSYVATGTGTDRVFNIGAGPLSSVRRDIFTVYRNSAAKFFPTELSGILNSSAGMFVFDSSDSNRPTIHNGTAWKKLAYQDDAPAITIDLVPTNGSTNAVSSDGVFDALALKADLVAGKVPSSQLPSYVDDVVEGYYSTGVFYSDAGLTTPITGEVGKIYVDLLLNQSYRWSGSVYVQISNAISGLNDLTDVTIATPLNDQALIYETSSSQWKNKTISGGVQLTRQEFAYAGGAQTFTLSATPSYIYAVFVNGQELNSSQYSFATTTLTIADTLISGYKVNIVYSETAGGVLDYYTKAQIDAFNYEPSHADFVEVNDLTDLPAASGGVITLVGGYTYLFLKHIDLLGSRLVCGQDTVIVGWSSENCSITSTGLSAASALVTSTYSLPIRNISFTHDLVFNLDGDGTTTALDWFGVNLLNCASGGTIKDYTNFVFGDGALLNSGGFTFDGSFGTGAFSNSLFDTASGKTAITVLPTCTFSRRLRIIYSSFVALSGETGINFNTSATIGDEKYILDTVNFSGGGTYITGVDSTSNKALFANCVGINNTSTRGLLYMINNATDTTIGVPNVNVWVKAAGTTTAGSISKFTHTSNRLTYTGAFNQSFTIHVNASVRSAISNQVISIGVAKNGTILAESEMTIRTSTSNQEHPGSTLAVIDMVATDYVELFVKNTASTDVRVSDLNMNITKIPV